ncbi:MAG: alpha-galactosidase [Bryobacterales bacterium]|nr:alpha-galactosidase [Bryobacteraceae bacterium]MDW8354021.1 alpha-galactosidase [Bryobacterales bacterium]
MRRAIGALAGAVLVGCGLGGEKTARIESSGIRIEFNDRMHTRITARTDGRETPLGAFQPSESVSLASGDVKDFVLRRVRSEKIRDRIGPGTRYTLTGDAASLRKTVLVTLYDSFPTMAVFQVSYENTGQGDVTVTGWTNHALAVEAQAAQEPAFWSLQAGSYAKRPDWVLPLQVGFRQENFLGMNATDYGGGTPVVDVWRRDAGLAVGHLELAPKLVSLPVARPEPGYATVAVAARVHRVLKPGEQFRTLRTFVAVHRGDYFETLVQYRRFMTAQGVRFGQPPEVAFEPIWCAWGFGRKFLPAQIERALPMVKRLGFGWVVVDDGWQEAEGDWRPVRSKFPRGDDDMRALVDRIHAAGFRAQLWWAPLAADPGTELLRRRPDVVLQTADGGTQKITWWDSVYLCPAYDKVWQDAREFVVRALREWDYDGLKIDGQHLNAAPPCYNPRHGHRSPEEAYEGLPGFFQVIYEAARSVKPDALVEICPCGTSYSFFTLPYLNMAVASDPTSSWQIRTKGKTLRALLGPAAVYFGDHVELSDDGTDFASTLGVGGVIGTNFVWPPAGRRRVDLTPEREQLFARWVEIYRRLMLPKGEYLGALYDIGFDRPEAHAIRKDGRMYYAFFAPSWHGPVVLRGLEPRPYRVTDYTRGIDYGTVKGPQATLKVRFERHLLLEAR